jgi:serine/threonine protein kinase
MLAPSPQTSEEKKRAELQIIKDEINILKQCSHDNITSYFGTWGPDSFGRLWIMMDCCEYGSVCDLLQTNRVQPTEKQVSYVMKQCLLALCYLHGKNIVHRDMKGSNILMDVEGRVKLADFGISAQRPDTKHPGKPKPENVAGTPLWMAPEVSLPCDCALVALRLARWMGRGALDFLGGAWLPRRLPL